MTSAHIARAMLRKHGLRLARVKIGARQFRYECVVPAMQGKHTAESIHFATFWRSVNRALDRVSP